MHIYPAAKFLKVSRTQENSTDAPFIPRKPVAYNLDLEKQLPTIQEIPKAKIPDCIMNAS